MNHFSFRCAIRMATVVGIVLPVVVDPVFGLEIVTGRGFALGVSARPNSQPQSLEGAALQTVPEQELFKLGRAKEFAGEGDFRSAISLWQSVLDASGEQLITRDQWRFESNRHTYLKYVTVAHEIEAVLGELSAAGLEAYRFRADGEARALLANPGNRSRMEVLGEVVRRFFLSSLGDEAAFELACLKLDRHEFTGASRLLKKCLHEHPSCTVPREELLLRMAVVNAGLGAAEAASQVLNQLHQDMQEDDRWEQVASYAAERQSTAGGPPARKKWHMKYGGLDRHGAMPALPGDLLSDSLSEAWAQDYDLYEGLPTMNANAVWAGGGFGGMTFTSSGLIDGRVLLHRGPGGISLQSRGNPKSKVDRKFMINQWKQHAWVPVGGMLLHKGMVYFRYANRVMCCSADTGEMQWLGRDNQFALDKMTQLIGLRQVAGATKRPTRPAEVQVFGDQLYQALSIGHGNLYSIEGPTALDSLPAPQNPRTVRHHHSMSVPARSRKNWLAAYDAVNGKLLWRRGARDDSIDDSKFEIGFSSAPIPGGRLEYVAVNDNGSISLLALDPASGATEWKTFLCDEPLGQCNRWATTGLACAGGDVYAVVGAGIVAAVDGLSGAVQWVVRYERSGSSALVPNPYGIPMHSGNVSGWREDVVVPTQVALVVMGSDLDGIFALDRRTGELLWDSPRKMGKTKVDYYLGTHGRRMFVGGPKCVRCYDVRGGRILWETTIDQSLGTGVLTDDAIYVPSQSEILRLSLDDGKESARAPLVTITREPVGNLYSDGERLLAIGMARVYALTGLQDRLDDLDRRAAQQDVGALLDRMRYAVYQGQLTAACEDLTSAFQIVRETATADDSNWAPVDQACLVGLEACDELNLPAIAPGYVLDMADRMTTDLAAAPSYDDSQRKGLRTRIETTVYRTLNIVRAERLQGLTGKILSIAPLCQKNHLNGVAVAAVRATASIADAGALREALDDPDETVRNVAVAGLIKVLGRDSLAATLRDTMENDASDRIRLMTALAVVNAKQRSALVVLSELLSSGDAEVRQRALAALESISGKKYNAGSPNPADSDTETQYWRDWATQSGATAKLSLPYVERAPMVGRTLVCQMQLGRVTEYDLQGNKTWTKNIQAPYGAHGLPNGHRVVASYSKKKVYEYDAKGKQVWEASISVGHPCRVMRLESGNTLVATQNAGRVVEIQPDGSTAWQYSASGNVMDARRMDNGNTLVAVQDGTLLEVDPTGEVLWSRGGLVGIASAQPLRNGNILIAESGHQRVREVTKEFETVWTQKGLAGVMDAQRLENGDTLVATASGVQQWTTTGKKVDAHVPLPSSKKKSTRRVIRGIGGIVVQGDPQKLVNRVFRY